jgi:alpha(1,3/1,4) fucosyltransferase
MKIYLGGHNASVPLHNASAPIVAGTEISLTNAFLAAGLEVCDHLSDANALVLIDMDIDLLQGAVKSASSEIPIIFIRYEPIVVWPSNYDSKAISLTSKLIDVGRHGGTSNSYFPWPQDWDQNLEFKEVVTTRSESVVLINGNKLSFIKGEMYSFRRKCVLNLPSLDVYGIGWDHGFLRRLLIFAAEIKLAIKNRMRPRLSNSRGWLKRPTNWKGAPKSKLETISKYKYSLVIENSMDYMTEKLFDAFFARCIPIYVGPDVGKYEIPANLVVRVEPTLNSIERGIEIAKAMDYEQWRTSLDAWLMSDAVFNKWSATNVYDAIAREVSNFIKNSLK